MRWVVVLALCSCAQTPIGEPVFGVPDMKDVPRDGMFFDCDAAATHFSSWSRPIDKTGSITGSVFIAETRDTPDWRANARVALQASDRRQAGFDMSVDKRGGQLWPNVIAFRPGAPLDRQPLTALPAVATFSLAWNPNGAQLRFDSPNLFEVGVPLPFTPERLVLTCSSGEAVFYKVTITSP